MCKKGPPPPLQRRFRSPLVRTLPGRILRSSNDGPGSCTHRPYLWTQIPELARRPLSVELCLSRCSPNALRVSLLLIIRCQALGITFSYFRSLILCKGSDHTLTYNQRVKLISRNCQTALRDDWITLWQRAIHTPAPPFRRLGENDAVNWGGRIESGHSSQLICCSPKGSTGQGLEATPNSPPNERHFRSLDAS